MAASGFIALHTVVYLYEISTTGGRFNVYGREAQLVPSDIFGWEVNIIMLREGIKSIFETVSDVRNSNSE